MKKSDELINILVGISRWMRTRPDIEKLSEDKEMFALFKRIYEKVKENV